MEMKNDVAWLIEIVQKSDALISYFNARDDCEELFNGALWTAKELLAGHIEAESFHYFFVHDEDEDCDEIIKVISATTIACIVLERFATLVPEYAERVKTLLKDDFFDSQENDEDLAEYYAMLDKHGIAHTSWIAQVN